MMIEEFTISELARRAGVSVRTIRYYIRIGLLPSPTTRGRYTIYSTEYLNRLKLIKRLKEAYLPLKEISFQMANLCDREIEELLEKYETGARGEPSHREPSPGSPGKPALDDAASASEYISRLLERQTSLKRSRQPDMSAHSPPQPPRREPNTPQPTGKGRSKTAESDRWASWRRIHLSDGVELNIQEPASPDDAERIQQLIDLAKDLFNDRFHRRKT